MGKLLGQFSRLSLTYEAAVLAMLVDYCALTLIENVVEGARYHHERYDGKGYPEGLAGEKIPPIARMICVADSFDAMNTNRVYRKKLTKEHILGEIESNKGKQFDPIFADVMLGLLRDGKIVMED